MVEIRFITCWWQANDRFAAPKNQKKTQHDEAHDTRLIVRTPDEYSGALSRLITKQSSGVLCEAWFEGTTISVDVLSNKRLTCFPVASMSPNSQHTECPASIHEQQSTYRPLAILGEASIQGHGLSRFCAGESHGESSYLLTTLVRLM